MVKNDLDINSTTSLLKFQYSASLCETVVFPSGVGGELLPGPVALCVFLPRRGRLLGSDSEWPALGWVIPGGRARRRGHPGADRRVFSRQRRTKRDRRKQKHRSWRKNRTVQHPCTTVYLKFLPFLWWPKFPHSENLENSLRGRSILYGKFHFYSVSASLVNPLCPTGQYGIKQDIINYLQSNT